jgi:outer membrane protein assembly factor BamB
MKSIFKFGLTAFIFLILTFFAGQIYAADGDIKWSYTTGSRILSAPAIANDGTIYNGSNDSYLYALNPDGSLKWKFKTGGQVWSSPAVASDGTIYVGSNDGKLYALSSDGLLKWFFQTGDQVGAPAIASDGTIYVGSYDKSLYALESNGTLKWSYETEFRVTASPAIAADGTIYINSDRSIAAISSAGSLMWSYETDFFVGGDAAIGADGTVYMGSYDGHIYALNPNGNLIWDSSVGTNASSPVVAKDGTIYIGSSASDELVALNSDGSEKWTFQSEGDVNYAPAIASDGTIYFGCTDGVFYAVDSFGRLKWSHDTDTLDNAFRSSPNIAPDGTVYIGSYDNNIYAFEGSAGLMNSPWPKLGRNNRKTGSELDDANGIPNSFSQSMLESEAFVIYSETRDTWIPSSLSMYSFMNDGTLFENNLPVNGSTRTATYTWAVNDGDILLTTEPSVSFYSAYSDSISRIFDVSIASQIAGLADEGLLTNSQVPVTTSNIETWTLLTREGSQLKVSVKIDTTTELQLPDGVSVFGNTTAQESYELNVEMIDLSLTTSELNSADMLGDWMFSISYTLPNYFRRSEPEVADRQFTGVMADRLSFNINGTATGEVSGKTFDWTIDNGAVTLTEGNLRYEINSFLNRGNQHLVHTVLYVDDVLSEEYAELVSKFDASASIFIDNLVTELPEVINADISSSNAANWFNDIRIFGTACCFAHQFSANGDMLFGIGTDSFSEPEKPQFSIPSAISSYSIIDDNIRISRNYNSDIISAFRTWVPISTDEFGRTYVLERSVRFDSRFGDSDQETGAGYFISPRINIFSKLDLSVYTEEYANSPLPQADNDKDGIPDATDPDDDNDGVEDGADAFPFDASETVDTDLDGIGNNADPDDDNDGVLDVDDAYPLDPTKSSDESARVRNDVDGDGNSDILWRSAARGWNFLWAMDGVAFKQARPINVVQDAGWGMDGQGDYDGDGKSDILWRNSITGLNFIYLMDGTTIKSRSVLNYVDAPDWAIKASGDFNGDGKGDVMWRRVNRGDTWFYMMNGTKIGTNQPSLRVTDLNFEITGAGDINGDGTDDVLWRNKVTGLNYIWQMESGQITNRYALNSINSDWTVAGLGDLDGDGTDDIILRNQSDGRNWAYLMENGQIRESVVINKVGNLNWQIANMGDYDGDGKTDFLWRNETTGQNIVHLMNGNTIKSRGVLRSTNNTWSVAK